MFDRPSSTQLHARQFTPQYVDNNTSLTQETSHLINLLKKNKTTEARAAWYASGNLRRWFRGENIYVLGLMAWQCISDQELLDHLDKTIIKEHGFFFRKIFTANPRLHKTIAELPANESADILVKICTFIKRGFDTDISELIKLLNREAIDIALVKLKLSSTKQPEYLTTRIKLLEPHASSLTPVQSSAMHSSFFKMPASPLPTSLILTVTPPATSATAAAVMPTLPLTLPIADFNMLDDSDWALLLQPPQPSPINIDALPLTDQDVLLIKDINMLDADAWTQPQSSLSGLVETELTDTDMEKWLETLEQSPRLRR